jgi:ABC-2 type transport system permease protein
MTAMLRAETLKLRTVLMPRMMLALAVLGGGSLTGIVVATAHHDGTAVTGTDLATAAAQPLWFLAVIVAVLSTAGEFQHRTIHSTLLQIPRRGRLLAAKTLVAAGYGAVLTAAGTIAGLTVGLLTMRLTGVPLPGLDLHLLATIAGTIVLGALWAVLAAGLGMLARSTAVALVALLLWRFVLEGILPSLITRPDLRPWLPSGTADAVLSSRADLPWPWMAALIFTGYAAVLTWAGAHRFHHWDA